MRSALLLLSDHKLTDLFASDIWDNMFFESIWGSPTIYNFPSGPATVLDVGCGTGWWVIQMARRWQVRSPVFVPGS